MVQWKRIDKGARGFNPQCWLFSPAETLDNSFTCPFYKHQMHHHSRDQYDFYTMSALLLLGKESIEALLILPGFNDPQWLNLTKNYRTY